MPTRPTLVDPFLDGLSTKDHVNLSLILKDPGYTEGNLDVGVPG